MNIGVKFLTICTFSLFACGNAQAQEYPDQLLWGDTHLHSNLSVDAYIFGNHTADADTAYRFAKGAPAIHPYTRAKVQLETPLDFLAVTDHAEMLGMPYSLFEQNDARLANSRLGKRLVELRSEGKVGHAARIIVWGMNSAGLSEAERTQKVSAGTKFKWWFAKLIGKQANVEQDLKWISSDPSLVDELNLADIARSNWEINIAAAERHNEPGKFTTLIGWEYSATRDGANLHRVVLIPEGGNIARKFLPFSSIDSINPEDLWHWLDETSAATGAHFVSIPHNSNVSKGQMFARIDSSGDPIDAKYAALRSRFETVAEVTQIKGTSETHPLLSPDDEFADFEFFRHLLEMRADRPQTPTPTEGDYVRSALKTGLEIENDIGINPYKLGMIGATDSHTGLASAEENNFMGKMALDSIPENKERGLGRLSGWSMSASGLSGVWARNNSRSEIIAAIKRREVYGTTGPRIALRFFGGFAFENADLETNNFATIGYTKGVPMGSDLIGENRSIPKAPSFLLHAAKDPKGANLDRIQVIKGWLDSAGHAQEKVFDAVWSGHRKFGANGKLPAIGDTVDRSTARYQNTIGSEELAGVWHDPDFNPDVRAFYYVRVLQIPTPRNSLYDSLALNKAPPKSYPQVLQERAYSSPIWYSPAPKLTE
ncbi:MAG: hypothetical protein COA47_03195 [Robiginitomaculum sp.]|nr:MAG: hypothetical protein COA47_03195 [Robiginitomaculum sp.]